MKELGNKEIMGRNIERYMQLHSIDRKQLAEALDVPYTTLTDWIKGNTYPRIDKIERMAQYFHIDKSDLVEEAHTPFQIRKSASAGESAWFTPLRDAYAAAPTPTQENVCKLLDIPHVASTPRRKKPILLPRREPVILRAARETPGAATSSTDLQALVEQRTKEALQKRRSKKIKGTFILVPLDAAAPAVVPFSSHKTSVLFSSTDASRPSSPCPKALHSYTGFAGVYGSLSEAGFPYISTGRERISATSEKCKPNGGKSSDFLPSLSEVNMPLTSFEEMEEAARAQGIPIDETTLQPDDPIDGLCVMPGDAEAPLILLNRHRTTRARHVALAEELGHIHKSTGDIIDQSSVINRKSENAGRAWAYEQLTPPETIRDYLRKGYFSFQEIAEELNVTPDFLLEAMAYYQRKGIVLNTAAQDGDDESVVILGRGIERLSPARYEALKAALVASAPQVFRSLAAGSARFDAEAVGGEK